MSTSLDSAAPAAEATPAGDTPVPRRANAAALATRYGTLVGFLALCVTFAVLAPSTFLSGPNLVNVLEQLAILAIAAGAQTIVMIVGDFDISIGALASLTGIIVAQLLIADVSPVIAIGAGLAAGLVGGAVNGFLVSYLGLNAFVSTLATMTSFVGLSLYLSSGVMLIGLPADFVAIGQGKIGTIPLVVVYAVLFLLVLWFVLARTVVGRSLYAVGGNPEAAFLSGVNTRAYRFAAFVAAGVGAAIAGILLTSRLASGNPTAGDPLALNSIAAVFIGITLSRAGNPTIGGTAIGLGIVGVLSNGLNILRVDSNIQQILTGLVIVLAVALSRVGRTARGSTS